MQEEGGRSPFGSGGRQRERPRGSQPSAAGAVRALPAELGVATGTPLWAEASFFKVTCSFWF